MRKAIIIVLLLVTALSCSRKGGFSEREKEIIVRSDSVMYVLTVWNKADSLVLRTPSVDIPSSELRGELFKMLCAKMLSTVTSPEQDGVGIAAPQVGINRRLVAVWRGDLPEQPFRVYPNVRLDSLWGDLAPGREGCLSVPPYSGIVRRYPNAIVSWTDPTTLSRLRDTVSGYTAVIFQHECDHLDAVLYPDRADTLWLNDSWAAERASHTYPRPSWFSE